MKIITGPYIIRDFCTPDKDGQGFVGKSSFGDKKIVLPAVKDKGSYLCLDVKEKEKCYISTKKIKIIPVECHNVETSEYWRKKRPDSNNNIMPIGIMFNGEKIKFPPFTSFNKGVEQFDGFKNRKGMFIGSFFVEDCEISGVWGQSTSQRRVYYMSPEGGVATDSPQIEVEWGEVVTEDSVAFPLPQLTPAKVKVVEEATEDEKNMIRYIESCLRVCRYCFEDNIVFTERTWGKEIGEIINHILKKESKKIKWGDMKVEAFPSSEGKVACLVVNGYAAKYGT